MGQLLIVNSSTVGQAAGVFDRALSLFESRCGLKPSDQLWSGSTGIAKFPRRHAPGTGIVQDHAQKSWICGTGTWFYNGSNGLASLRVLQGVLAGSNSAADSIPATIDGAFALAFGREGTEGFDLITDRLGSLHVYMAQIEGCVVVSTSSLVLAALARPAWDRESCTEFLATGTVFESRSLFEGIEKLWPATVFHFQNGRLRSHSKYWDLAATMYDRTSRRGDVPHLAAALKQAVQSVVRSFRRPVFDLTGGFDSRLLLGATLRAGASVDTVVNGKQGDADVTAANRIAQEFALRHRHQEPAPDCTEQWWKNAKASLALCDGEYDVLEYARILEIHRALAGQFDASVNGSGGEVCKGYWWELLFPFTGCKGHFDARHLAARRFVPQGGVPALLATDNPANLTEHFAEIICRANRGFEGLPNTAKVDNVYLTLRMQRWQGRVASATSRLWPCVSPFLFRQPLEIALSAPPATRVRHRMTRRLIEYLNPKLAGFPLAQGYPALPLRFGTLHRFAPLASEVGRKIAKRLPGRAAGPSVANPLKELSEEAEVREMLEARSMASRDLYKERELGEFLRLARGDHFSDAPLFGRILTLELLARAVRA
jgi:hypothetical protein